MQMPKATDDDKDFFRSVVPSDPGVQVKPMFGNLGAFVNGNMFAALFGASIGVRLDDDARAQLELVDGVGPFGPAERPMGAYLALPAAWRDQPEQASEWVALAHSQVSSLPPKAQKQKRTGKPDTPIKP